mmetsp:Transcript_7670/g.22738  ORF Transcript_7670/g.22738 Transcript_7670/m.22738 type:complete len:402 (-) Transcript_7670:28-1233(-)
MTTLHKFPRRVFVVVEVLLGAAGTNRAPAALHERRRERAGLLVARHKQQQTGRHGQKRQTKSKRRVEEARARAVAARLPELPPVLRHRAAHEGPQHHAQGARGLLRRGERVVRGRRDVRPQRPPRERQRALINESDADAGQQAPDAQAAHGVGPLAPPRQAEHERQRRRPPGHAGQGPAEAAEGQRVPGAEGAHDAAREGRDRRVHERRREVDESGAERVQAQGVVRVGREGRVVEGEGRVREREADHGPGHGRSPCVRLLPRRLPAPRVVRARRVAEEHRRQEARQDRQARPEVEGRREAEVLVARAAERGRDHVHDAHDGLQQARVLRDVGGMRHEQSQYGHVHQSARGPLGRAPQRPREDALRPREAHQTNRGDGQAELRHAHARPQQAAQGRHRGRH